MAMDKTVLQPLLATAIEQQVRDYLQLGVNPLPKLTSHSNALAEAIASKVIEHIVSNAELFQARTNPSTGNGEPVIGKIK